VALHRPLLLLLLRCLEKQNKHGCRGRWCYGLNAQQDVDGARLQVYAAARQRQPAASLGGGVTAAAQQLFVKTPSHAEVVSKPLAARRRPLLQAEATTGLLTSPRVTTCDHHNHSAKFMFHAARAVMQQSAHASSIAGSPLQGLQLMALQCIILPMLSGMTA
jgi:hypothetical protein